MEGQVTDSARGSDNDAPIVGRSDASNFGDRIVAWADGFNRRLLVWILSGLALLTTVVLAVLGEGTKPLSAGVAGLLVVVAGVLQLAAAAVARQTGRIDKGHFNSGVTRLTRMGVRAKASRIRADAAFDSTPLDMKHALGAISVELSWIEEGLEDAVVDWIQADGGQWSRASAEGTT